MDSRALSSGIPPTLCILSQEKKKPHINEGFSIDPPVPEARELGVRRSAPRRVSGGGGSKPQPPVSSGNGAKPPSALAPWILALRHTANVAMVILNALAAAGLIFSAYAQRIPPSDWPFAVVVTMTFPAWLWLSIALFAVDLAWWRRTAWIPGLAMLACVGQIHDYMPLNLPHLGMNAEDKERALTVMTYNVMALNDFQHRELGYNRQLSYIKRKNPDIACLQEAHYLRPTKANEITQSQLDSLHTLYPYVMMQGENFALLSKYPAQSINLDFPTKEFKSGEIAGWRLHVRGKIINLFSVHLRSFSLTPEDKDAYKDIVRLDSVSRKDVREAKNAIIPKLKDAGVERAEQVKLLQKYLSRYGGKNAIVCGDFNDPVGCYGLWRLTDESHMKQAYAETGFGPMITYHANDLFFRIDHILYRGQMRAWSIKKGRTKASDHYPLTATFILE